MVSPVPILIYHRVANDHEARPEDGVVRPATFRRQLAYLRRGGWHTATLDEVLDHQEGVRALPRRAVVLTFDDATVDHWTHVAPILAEAGARATFFVPTGLIDDGPPRPTIADVAAGRVTADALPPSGAVRWSELAALCGGGHVEIESHGHRHGRRVAGPDVVAFLGPDAGHERLGEPVYEDGPALEAPAWEPDPAEAAMLRRHAHEHPALARMSSGERGRVLAARLAEWRAGRGGPPGRQESRAAWLARVEDDLRTSRDALRERLGVVSRFLAWPYGRAASDAHGLALRLGFRATLVSESLPVGTPPRMVRRLHFGEDYRGPFETSVQYWRFVRTLERSCEIGVRRHLSPLLRLPLRLLGRSGGAAR